MSALDRLAVAIEMSARLVDSIDNPGLMTSLQRIKLYWERDAVVQSLSTDELALFRAWAAQEQPS